ncbi:CRISPR-associated helicase Cas3' [Streptomyces bohaiensis]|uniref:CRISPR-associated helicase Cas3 n=1 Tax=Streptomyces bohaiensis TaxID=1431344 RepID=A0ABX1C695_9ACTN|nr:CRISPR-associated helicase Cas3' [Streptomyces bohaiensis]
MLGVLWGKSEEKGGGRKNLLLSHLLDTAAVAERMWDGFLAPSTKQMLDEVAGGAGKGRLFFAWLCGVHDCGKATPAFQRLWPKGAAEVRAAGLSWNEAAVARSRWRHDCAGGFVVRRLLPAAGWDERHVGWVWPLVAGHHGRFPEEGQLTPSRRAMGQLEGGARWAQVQRALVERFSRELGFGGLAAVAPVVVPSRAFQLHMSGLIVMADWIASDEQHFGGVDDVRRVTLGGARLRAERAWGALGLCGGWGVLAEPGPGAFRVRFGEVPRSSQVMVVEAAGRMECPGLLVVEAPMGEGKTKAALLAAEVLAARFGADGVFVGMPTQATCDPMFESVRGWVGGVDGGLASRVALLHGKRMFNREWRGLVDGARRDAEAQFGGVDEYGDCCEDDPYGAGAAVGGVGGEVAARGPAQWFLGAKRGLLCPFVVGTIDQLLFAATRTKHVMLRMAGLVGKVVVLDEVHAADVYMSQFLGEGLRWLGQAGVPVVLLSATLPPGQRRALVGAYVAGAASREEYEVPGLPEPAGYPSVTAAWMGPGGEPGFLVEDCGSWRADLRVRVELLPEAVAGPGATRERQVAVQEAADRGVGDFLEHALAEGGRALVIRNTVGRAQSLYEELRGRVDGRVVLLHGRIAVGPRADRTVEVLRLLSALRPDDGSLGEGGRLVVVATQVAEQSFDVDADVLVTDLAPIDLLLQRIGRLHRHDGVARPARLREPRVVVTGFDAASPGGEGSGAVPRFLGASEGIYGRYLLLRAAALVGAAGGGGRGWSVPGEVPSLVAAGYEGAGGGVPAAWADDMESAREVYVRELGERADAAVKFLLSRRGDRESATLAGLHRAALPPSDDAGVLQAVVRDGDPSVEVILVVGAEGGYRTLSGRALTVNGDVAEGLLDDVLAGTVRLPPSCTKAVAQELLPLPGWRGDARLRYSPALVLDTDGRAELGDRSVRYDADLGLVLEAAGAARR